MSKNKEITVGIFGGGIAGLTVAHQLIKKGFSVDLFEFNPVLGGLARTERRKEDDEMPTETSWRGIGPFYYNFFNLLKDIPNNDNKEQTNSVFGTKQKKTTLFDTELSDQIEFSLPLNKSKYSNDQKEYNDAYQWLNRFSFFDKFYLYYNLLKYLSSDKRRKDYEKINVCKMMINNLTMMGYHTVQSLLGPFAGLDPQSASFSHIAHFFEMQVIEWINPKAEGLPHWAVFKQPTSESWIDPWVLHLKNLGVKFHLEHKLEKINLSCFTITNVDLIYRNTLIKKSFDYYILAVNPFNVQTIVEKDSRLSLIPELKMFKELTAQGTHVQLSFIISFEDKILWPGNRTCIALPDSAFNISLYQQDELWHSQTYLGKNIKSLWSGTACIGYQHGILFNKPVTKCTRKEFFKEIIAQMYGCKEFCSIIQEANNGRLLKSFKILQISTWYTWRFIGDDESTKTLTTVEPKWVTSTTNEKYRPYQRTNIDNLILSGAHTKTTCSLYSMEGAVESGLNTVNVLLQDEHQKLVNVVEHRSPGWVKFLQKFHNIGK
jgi:uncharacterized protein with NAD-binding domain and iron-sulfur cluster